MPGKKLRDSALQRIQKMVRIAEDLFAEDVRYVVDYLIDRWDLLDTANFVITRKRPR